jgi:hypothetical protein
MTKKEYIANATEMGIPKAEAEKQWDLKNSIPFLDEGFEEEDDDDFDLEDVSDRYGD